MGMDNSVVAKTCIIAVSSLSTHEYNAFFYAFVGSGYASKAFVLSPKMLRS